MSAIGMNEFMSIPTGMFACDAESGGRGAGQRGLCLRREILYRRHR